MIVNFVDAHEFLRNDFRARFIFWFGRTARIRCASVEDGFKVLEDHLQLEHRATRLRAMHDLVFTKFLAHDALREQLLATGDRGLVYGNLVHDNEWGICYCGKCYMRACRHPLSVLSHNELGKILVDVRQIFLEEDRRGRFR